MNEQWVAINGYEDQYEISNLGRVKSLRRSMILSPYKCPGGYLMVTLALYGLKDKRLVHRLVADAFIPNPEDKPEVNHRDFCKENNHADNLEWNTAYENTLHTIVHGRKVCGFKSKLTVEQVKEIKVILRDIVSDYKSCFEIARQFGVSFKTIHHIQLGNRWAGVTI